MGPISTVVGVMAARFTDVDDDLMDDSPCFYIPLEPAARLVAAPDLLENCAQRSLIVYGSLCTGVLPRARAQAEAATIAAEIEKDHPDTNRNRKMVVRICFSSVLEAIPQSPSPALR